VTGEQQLVEGVPPRGAGSGGISPPRPTTLPRPTSTRIDLRQPFTEDMARSTTWANWLASRL